MKIKKYSLKKSLKHLLESPASAQQCNPGDTINEGENDVSECNLKKSEADFHNSFIFT